MTELIRDVRGTPEFMPPEAVNSSVLGSSLKNGYLPSSADIYAIGATLFFIIFGHPPYHEENQYALYKQAINDPIPFDKDENIQIAKLISPQLRNLLEVTLEKDPSKRVTMDQMRIHPWVTCNGTHPLPVELEKVDVTENEINFALTPLLPWSQFFLIYNYQ
ncbi:MAG: putative calmodulin dependent protein kinase [Streblomastix strix]|uniref:Putative calmodulin dependent protein kinase n=2 Tax=Streblomastix strix TaxID=222440 RepID=A0A5J4TIQ1_9EUKA|nr:MAG: putative calmodulin dependent protein kinase [Streblomastix strix]